AEDFEPVIAIPADPHVDRVAPGGAEVGRRADVEALAPARPVRRRARTRLGGAAAGEQEGRRKRDSDPRHGDLHLDLPAQRMCNELVESIPPGGWGATSGNWRGPGRDRRARNGTARDCLCAP